MKDCTKDKEFKVNDIVRMKDELGEGIVTGICPSGVVYILWKDGSCGDFDKSDLEEFEFEKTGRTAEGLDLLLQQL